MITARVAPPSPVWLVRNPPRTDDVEIVFVGVANRDELDRHVERLAKWPWPFEVDDPAAGVTLLGDIRGEAVGVRLSGLEPIDAPGYVRDILADLFEPLLVAQAFRASVAKSLCK